MSFSGRLPRGPLRQQVRAASVPVTTSRDNDTNATYGTSDAYTTVGTRSVLLFSPDERQRETVAGDEQRADLAGMMLPDVDVLVGDRIEYGDAVYEVNAIVGVPDDTNPAVHEITFERV